MLYINSFCIMYSVCICSWWWDVHTCIYFVSSVVFVDFLIKSSFQTFLWNDIMRNVDVSVSLFKFKKDLKLYLLNNNLKLGYTIM